MGLSPSKPETMPETVYFTKFRDELPRMEGKTVCVTGCTSGMGLVCALTCGNLGARVVMLNRKSSRADDALGVLKEAGIEAELVLCDLSSFESVREAAKELKKVCAGGIDVLCNNAGVMGLLDQATDDGFDIQMQCNHLSHFLLVAEVWDLLEIAAEARGEARVVNHSSGARNKIDAPIVKTEYFQKNGGNLGGDFWPLAKWRRYQQSKLANVLFAYALSERAEKHGSKVKVLVAHPGATLTNLQMKTFDTGQTGFVDSYILNSTMKNAHSEEDGSMGLVMCCCLPEAKSGDFYGPVELTGKAVLLPPERDAVGEEVLWNESVASTGAVYFGEGKKEGKEEEEEKEEKEGKEVEGGSPSE